MEDIMDTTKLTDDFIIQSPLPHIDIPICDLWSFLQQKIIEFGDKIAFTDPVSSRSLSYKDILDKTELIAKNLLANGFSSDKILTICMSNSLDYMLILLSVWRIGAKCAILTAYLKEAEMTPLIEQLGTEFIVTNAKSVDVVKSATSHMKGIKIICDTPSYATQPLSDFFIEPEIEDRVNLTPSTVNPENDTILIVFSSGTTSSPKPMEISHSMLVRQFITYSVVLDLETLQNGALLYQPLSHVWTLLISFSHFIHGQRILIMPEPDLKQYVSLASEHQIERLHMAPPCAVYLCKSGITSQYSLSHVKYICVAAASLRKEIEEELSEVLRYQTKIVQLFGASEVGVAAAVPMKPGVKATSGSVGWPISNVSAKIRDCETGVNLGPHKEGELCFKTKYPMKGYLGYIEHSSQFFDKYGFYKTGDLAYYDEKGCIFIVDRLKEVMKVGAVQVAPAFLEVLLLTHPCVADAGVTSVPDPEYVEVPHAWVVKKPGKDVTEDELHVFVNERVNLVRRIRGGIKFVDVIPKSPSGKILRRIIKEQSRSEMKK